MTPRQLDELHSMPSGREFIVVQALKRAGRKRAAELLDDYEERIAIICEGREAREEDFSAAWECVLRLKFPPPREREVES